MKKIMIKKNEGITLIALVITIIVLLILAGVSINMIGEGSIIEQAQTAKVKYNSQSEIEKIELNSIELQADMELEGKRDISVGGGVAARIEEGDSVESFLSKLPSGYTMKETTGEIKNGMEILKDGKVVARTILYGDIDCDGRITNLDGIDLLRIVSKYKGYEIENLDYYKVLAADVDNNGILNSEDSTYFFEYVAGYDDREIEQNRTPIGMNDLKIEI